MLPPGATVAEPLSPSLSTLASGSYLSTGPAGRGGITGFSPILLPGTKDHRTCVLRCQAGSWTVSFLLAASRPSGWYRCTLSKPTLPPGCAGTRNKAARSQESPTTYLVQKNPGGLGQDEAWHPRVGFWSWRAVGRVGEEKSLTPSSHQQLFLAPWSRSLEQP